MVGDVSVGIGLRHRSPVDVLDDRDDAAMLRFDVVGMCLPRFFVMGVALVIVRGRGLVDGAKRSENGDDMQ